MNIRLTCLVAIAVLLAACESAPVTGRKQLMLVPESQAIAASKDAYAQTLAPIQKSGKLNDDAALKARVDKITARLVAQAILYRPDTANWDWQVAVIDDPKTLNAWCMAGGRMAIYTGIIQKLNLTDDEIAEVMGHEIAHALAKHTAERMSTAMASEMALAGRRSAAGRKQRNDARWPCKQRRSPRLSAYSCPTVGSRRPRPIASASNWPQKPATIRTRPSRSGRR